MKLVLWSKLYFHFSLFFFVSPVLLSLLCILTKVQDLAQKKYVSNPVTSISNKIKKKKNWRLNVLSSHRNAPFCCGSRENPPTILFLIHRPFFVCFVEALVGSAEGPWWLHRLSLSLSFVTRLTVTIRFESKFSLSHNVKSEDEFYLFFVWFFLLLSSITYHTPFFFSLLNPTNFED